jgi:hypothetical protein
MGLSAICDGCQKSVVKYKEEGFVKKMIYCDDCHNHYLLFEQAVDSLRVRLGEEAKIEIAKLMETWYQNYPGAKLPDV